MSQSIPATTSQANPDALAACEGCLSRRAFVSQAVLAAAAAALAACGGGADATAPSTIGATIRVSDYPALANVGGVALASVNGASLAIVRTSTTQFLALSRVCPHEAGRIDPVSSGFLCQKHGARFSATGAWTGGQRTSSMRAYPTSYDASTGVLSIG